MKILFDQETPVPLRNFLIGHQVSTAFEMGWSNLSNGDLIDAAVKNDFDILVTTGQDLKYQQNLSARTISIVVLLSANWPQIQRHLAPIVAAVESTSKGGYVEVPVG